VLEPGILDYIPPHTFYDFGHDLFPLLLEKGVPMYGYPISADEYLIDIGTMEKYQRAQRQWARAYRLKSIARGPIPGDLGPRTNRPRTTP
jgi:NDP-sugar pyrophosphorylase family protein